jgi:hypothetical protein
MPKTLCLPSARSRSRATPVPTPAGDCLDGGLIDYHLLLPYRELDSIVLYPHFAPFVTPGWLDKFLPWRKRPRAHPCSPTCC